MSSPRPPLRQKNRYSRQEFHARKPVQGPLEFGPAPWEPVRSSPISIPKEAEDLFGIDLLNIPRSKIPACTHVDYSARVQTVDGKHNPIFYDLICEFDKLTGVPVLLNTSFNVRGEPIVCTPDDAVRCFLGTGIDTLIIGNFLIQREDVNSEIIAQMANYEEAFELD